jgi:hypothetical protein
MYLAVLVGIAILWRPGPNSRSIAYAEQVAQNDFDDEFNLELKVTLQYVCSSQRFYLTICLRITSLVQLLAKKEQLVSLPLVKMMMMTTSK